MQLKIISLIIWIISVLTITVILPLYLALWAITVLFDRKLKIVHFAVSYWASIYTILNPFWHISIENRDKFRKGRTYVIISNHQSLLDILLLFRLFRHFKWVSKIENFRIPVVGWIMTMNNYIKIRRGDKKSILKMMHTCRKILGSGISILMFPEGTRSEDGNIGKFKEGAFNLALETGTDILPIIIDGALQAIPKKGLLLSKKQTIRIRILDEIPATEYINSGVSEIRNRAYGIMNDELCRLRESK